MIFGLGRAGSGVRQALSGFWTLGRVEGFGRPTPAGGCARCVSAPVADPVVGCRKDTEPAKPQAGILARYGSSCLAAWCQPGRNRGRFRDPVRSRNHPSRARQAATGPVGLPAVTEAWRKTSPP
jgi:hypothetical protein